MTHALILAQGMQTRLAGHVDVPKCLLRLEPGGESIIARTIRLCFGLGVERITVVAEKLVALDLSFGGVLHGLWSVGGDLPRRGAWIVLAPPRRAPGLEVWELAHTGNSSLRGLQRMIEGSLRLDGGGNDPDRNVVLLGDTVYSNACLETLIAPEMQYAVPVLFAVTPDLSPGGGELYGFAYDRGATPDVQRCIMEAPHPPVDDDYQPGQLRRILWQYQETFHEPWYARTPSPACCYFVTDYTKDIDTPADLARLPELAAAAAADR